MDEQVQAAPEGEAPEVVTTEAQDQVAEHTESEAEGEGAVDKEPVSEAAKRRERREKQIAALRESEAAANARFQEAEARLKTVQDAAKALKEPKQSDFDNYDDYTAAKTAWVAVQSLDQREAERVKAELAERRQEVEAVKKQKDAEAHENWAAHAADAASRYSDFDAVVYNPALPVTQRVFDAVKQSEMPADVAYQIALDPSLARSLAGMNDLELGRAIGRIEATLSRPRPRLETQAPPPISPVKAKGTVTPDPERMTMAEYMKWRQGR